MIPAAESSEDVTCMECDAIVEYCAVCEREDCPGTICYRCLRIQIGQMVPQPHPHGG